MGQAGTRVTDRARAKFLERLRQSPNVSEAARVAGFSRLTAYRMRNSDPEFAANWDDALEEAVDRLEQVAWTRAEKTSDRLIEILLKGHRPEKYVERRLLGSDPANPLPSAVTLDASKLSTETLRELMAARPDATDAG